MLNNSLESGLVNGRQLTQSTTKLAELVVDVDVSTLAVLDSISKREGEDWFRQLAQIYR